MVMRATCHHEVRGTCSQEEGSLQGCFSGSSAPTTMAAPREVAGGRGEVIELPGLMGTVRFVRFSDPTAGLADLIPVQPLSGLIDQIGPET